MSDLMYATPVEVRDHFNCADNAAAWLLIIDRGWGTHPGMSGQPWRIAIPQEEWDQAHG